MSGKVFIDTNVLVYAHTDLDPRKQLLAQNLILENDTCISTQVLQELSNVLFKKFGKSWSEIESVLANVIEANGTHTNSETTVIAACKLAATYRYSFYDCLILSAALEGGCTTLLSEDLSDGQTIEGTCKIVNPFR